MMSTGGSLRSLRSSAAAFVRGGRRISTLRHHNCRQAFASISSISSTFSTTACGFDDGRRKSVLNHPNATVLQQRQHNNSNLFYGRNFSSSSAALQHPLDPLTGDEISLAASIVQSFRGLTPDNVVKHLRFVSISLLEPPKKEFLDGQVMERHAEIVALDPLTGIASEYSVNLQSEKVVDSKSESDAEAR